MSKHMHAQRRPLLSLPAGASRRPLKTHKVKRWSHQHELDELEGATIVLIFRDGSRLTGTLLHADQFALRLAHADKSVLTYFKHDIRGYARAAG